MITTSFNLGEYASTYGNNDGIDEVYDEPEIGRLQNPSGTECFANAIFYVLKALNVVTLCNSNDTFT